MGSLKRKINRKKQLKKDKESKKKLKQVLNATMGIPTKCSNCNASFDPIEDADTWIVTFHNENTSLFCPACNEEVP